MEQARNDALLVLLVVLGLYLAERAMRRRRFPLGALVVLLAALSTKQTALFAVVAVVSVLFLHHRRQALLWTALFLAAAAAGLLLWQLWSGGWFLFYLVRVPAGVGFEGRHLDFALTFFLVTLGAGTAAALEARRGLAAWRARPVRALWPLAFLLGAAACTLQSLKWGAAPNAFLPVLPLMGLLAADWYTARLASPRRWTAIGAGALMLLQIGVLFYRPLLPTESLRETHAALADMVRDAPGDVLVSGFSSHVVMNGKRYFGDPVIMGDLEAAGLWPEGESAVVKKVARRGFGLLVLRPVKEMSPADLKAAVLAHYLPRARIPFDTHLGGWPFLVVWTPKETPETPAPSEAGAGEAPTPRPGSG
jgi:hypothetical protein